MGTRKTLQELTLKDDFMFGAVMLEEENCLRLLELVLGFSIERVVVSKEKSLVYHPEYHGVRLDIYAKDENNTRYNVEMQVTEKPALSKRSRYYHSQMDMELLSAGEHYSELPDMYVIFICDFDPFHKEKYRYSFQNICRESGELFLKDGTETIFLSTCGTNDDEVPKELVEFLHFVKDGQVESTNEEIEEQVLQPRFVDKLKQSMERIKMNREMEDRYMLLEELIQDERAEAKAEGRAEGKIEGKAEGELQGRTKAKTESILILLNLMGTVPESLKERLEKETDLSVLDSYLEKAAKAASVTEFITSIS